MLCLQVILIFFVLSYNINSYMYMLIIKFILTLLFYLLVSSKTVKILLKAVRELIAYFLNFDILKLYKIKILVIKFSMIEHY